VADVPFQVGPWSHAACWALACALLGYAVAMGFHAGRGFRRRLPDRWSCLGTTLALAVLAGLVAARGPALVPAPFSIALVAVMAGAVLYTFVFTLLRLQRVVDLLRERLPVPELVLDDEARRKVPHLLMGLFLALYAFAGHFFLVAAAGVRLPDAANVDLARDAGWLAGGHVVGVLLLLAILLILLPVELVRLRFPDADYPWKRIIVTRLRRHEAELAGAHIHMSAGLAVVFVGLTGWGAWEQTVMAALGVLSVTVFADAASALVGKRWGRRKWFHNPGKSYLGSLGGTAVALLVAWPFVGLPMALLFALAFLVVDAAAPMPVPVSDNLLNPASLGLLALAFPGLVEPALPWY
jgi:dolichol kinase